MNLNENEVREMVDLTIREIWIKDSREILESKYWIII